MGEITHNEIVEVEWPWKVTQVPIKLKITKDQEVHRQEFNGKKKT